jgi:hypothetical protein
MSSIKVSNGTKFYVSAEKLEEIKLNFFRKNLLFKK